MIAKGCSQILSILAIISFISGIIYMVYHGVLALILFLVFTVFTVFSLFFFRDPERHIGGDDQDMVSPADGIVMSCTGRRVSIFMNLSDIHVNRAPFDGIVKCIKHEPGSYVPAFKKESENNERNHILLESVYGDVLITQIAGVFARRIVTYITKDSKVVKGERIGMIRYGSRVDVTVPRGCDILVSDGDKVRCGETIIARVVEY